MWKESAALQDVLSRLLDENDVDVAVLQEGGVGEKGKDL